MAILSIPTSVAGVSIPSGLFNPNSPLALLYGGLGVKTYKYQNPTTFNFRYQKLYLQVIVVVAKYHLMKI